MLQADGGWDIQRLNP
ncbi:hypothetical protein OAV31_01540 [bacterium]|nr:hypothetical protein [bacterium]